MRSILRIILVAFVMMSFARSSLADDYDFRKTKWGMSMDEVKQSEKDADFVKFDSSDNHKILFYTTNLLNQKINLQYWFTHEDKLVSAGYHLGNTRSHTYPNQIMDNYYLEDTELILIRILFDDAKDGLIQKYGQPILHTNEGFGRKSPTEYSRSEKITWRTDTTLIELNILIDIYITPPMAYFSLVYKPLEDEGTDGL